MNEPAAKSARGPVRAPLASIVIPTRDEPALLKRAVASIREKSLAGAFEIIVVNNVGSPDNTEAALASLGSTSDVSLIDADGASTAFARLLVNVRRRWGRRPSESNAARWVTHGP